MKKLNLLIICLLTSYVFFAQNKNNKVDSLFNLIEKNKKMNNDSIVIWGTELLKVSNETKDDTIRYKASKKISYYYLRNRIFDSVKKYDMLMLTTARKIDCLKVMSSLQNQAAYFNNVGLKDSALYVLERAKRIGHNNLKSKTKEDSLKKINSILYIETAIVKNYFKDKEFEKALELSYSNLNTSNKYGITKFLPYNFFYLGLINLELGNLDEALKYYQKEFELSLKQENPYMKGYALIHLGNVFYEKEDIPVAKEYYVKANTLFEENNYLKGKLSSKRKLFSIYEKEENYGQASKIGEDYISMYLKTGQLDNYLASFFIKLGRVYHKAGNLLKAREYIEKGLGYASKYKNKDNVNIINEAYITYKELGDYKMALENHEILTELRDSLLLNELT
ncbi:MAG: tetratricopeptide repeat protein [Xanthomarina gelatinilytica]|uniref:tetratricopeptide repeat protein n=1 Tax=Xanthomarina gelatinilytica TaxID=1137281 RepID=UPI003A887E73